MGSEVEREDDATVEAAREADVERENVEPEGAAERLQDEQQPEQNEP